MYRKMTRAALLLALMIVLQAIRLFVPVPPFISMFVIGSGVNACLLLAVVKAGWQAALVLAITAPVIAALQQFMPTLLFIVPVAVANITYIIAYLMLLRVNRWLAVGAAATAKMLALYITIWIVLKAVVFTGSWAAALQMMFGYPQLVTGAMGGVICHVIVKRLEGVRQ